MAWYSDESVFTSGRHNGKKVKEVNDAEYIKHLHESSLNIYFLKPVLDRLGIITTGKIKESK